ncbi:hypothetical protein MADA3029_210006 [Vibrio nigripulchritudo MADA3029]|nr:hypothetical protein VIBNIMADA3020_480007 [Vibrio nigripulchritudo MADA3020]CCN55246.1 hypothetical protein VIBNIMADA3021_710006 [Vibrio nigripulchritudo MADA3021]CCN58616.1 hypothetical protein MADA3029_210006 [Vibrio nigripulchritudo MADA3029]
MFSVASKLNFSKFILLINPLNEQCFLFSKKNVLPLSGSLKFRP